MRKQAKIRQKVASLGAIFAITATYGFCRAPGVPCLAFEVISNLAFRSERRFGGSLEAAEEALDSGGGAKKT
jgi:hypothetical protein